MIVAGIALFDAFLWFLEFPGAGLGLGMSILPLVILFYLNSGEVKAAFSVDEPQAVT